MLTGNLGDKLIPQNEILRDVSDLKTLANLQESMEWLSSRLKGFFINLPHAASEYTRTHAEAGRHTHTPYGFHSCRAGGVCVGRGAGVRCVWTEGLLVQHLSYTANELTVYNTSRGSILLTCLTFCSNDCTYCH